MVDDNRDAAASLALMLELMGHETRTAHDGLEALDAAPAFRPDVILLDIGMPRLDGIDTARRIRAAEWGRGAVLVALTGWGQEADRRRSREAGFDHHLTKPAAPPPWASRSGPCLRGRAIDRSFRCPQPGGGCDLVPVVACSGQIDRGVSGLRYRCLSLWLPLGQESDLLAVTGWR